MLNKKSRLARAIKVIFEGVTKNNYDNVLVIAGDEGKGKSNILLHITDYWLELLFNKVDPKSTSKYIAMDSKDLGKIFRNISRYDLLANDEAGDLSSRGAMTKLNKTYVKAYNIIRGKNLFTILVLPDLFDLDPFFRKRRVKHLIYTDKRGVIHFWGKKRLKKLVELNETYKVKNYFAVRPLFSDRLPIYEGALKPEYDRMKEEKLNRIQEELYNELVTGVSENGLIRETRIMKLIKEDNGWTNAKMSQYFGLTPQAIGHRFRLLEREQENEREAL